MIVNSNAASLFTRRVLGRSGLGLEVTTARLASGVRINSAADDAAGLAISDRMSTQVNGQGQARRNVNDAVSMAQTAEGALQQSADVLQRIRQLAVQAANGTNSQQDRASLQAEVDQLVAEFDRVSKDTEFNSRKLLDGSSLTASVHVGYKGWQAVGLGVQSSRAEDLYSYELGSDISTTSSMQAAQTATSDGHAGQRNRLQTQNLAINGRGMTGSVVLQAGLSAKDVADRMNHALVQKDGLLAARAETYALMTFASSQSASVSLKLNGVSIQAYADRADTDVDGVIAAINNESVRTRVVASKQALSGGSVGVVLHAVQGEDIQLSQVSVALGTGGATGTVGVQGLYAENGSFGSVGAAVSLTAGGLSTALRNTTVGGRVLMTGDSAYTISHSAAGTSGGLFAYAPNTMVSSYKGSTLWQVKLDDPRNSTAAIAVVDAVLARVNSYRAGLGAMQNRFDFTKDNLSTSVENASAARSRVKDADMAEETSNLARVQVVQQAGVAMLAQANNSASRALELLR